MCPKLPKLDLTNDAEYVAQLVGCNCKRAAVQFITCVGYDAFLTDTLGFDRLNLFKCKGLYPQKMKCWSLGTPLNHDHTLCEK